MYIVIASVISPTYIPTKYVQILTSALVKRWLHSRCCHLNCIICIQYIYIYICIYMHVYIYIYMRKLYWLKWLYIVVFYSIDDIIYFIYAYNHMIPPQSWIICCPPTHCLLEIPSFEYYAPRNPGLALAQSSWSPDWRYSKSGWREHFPLNTPKLFDVSIFWFSFNWRQFTYSLSQTHTGEPMKTYVTSYHIV